MAPLMAAVPIHRPFGIWPVHSRHRPASLVSCRLASIFKMYCPCGQISLLLCQIIPPIEDKVNHERTLRKIVTNLKALIWRQFFSFHFLLVLGPGRDLLPVDIPICQQNKHGHKNSSLNTPHFIFLSHNTMQWPHFMYFFKVSKGHNYRHRPNISILWHLTQPSTEMFEISILKSLQKYFKSLCWKWTGIQLLSPSNQYHNKPRLWCRHSAWQFYHPNWIHPCSQL